MDNAAIIAPIRFGLGRTPAQPVADPQRWLGQQLQGADPGPPAASVAEALGALKADRAARRTNPTARPGAEGRAIFRADTAALLAHAVTTPSPFRERLVWFWANHFTVSTRKGMIAPLAACYVREAIRPHAIGRFSSMLLAVMRHPAMLIYLDNAQSAGPRSLAGGRPNRGLNENLARECLELHTVGPDAGYSQADVTEFARILTGWSVDREDGAGFRFRPGLAEPGEKRLLGQRFPEGEPGGMLALQFLADHPSTHKHLATKLVRHFVADTPPTDAVRRIEGVLRDTGGDLGAASLELTRLPAAWRPLTKLRTPGEYVVAAFRAADLAPDQAAHLAPAIGGLGQPAFGAPAPIGWPDTGAEWTGPEAVMRRVDWAHGFAGRSELPDPMPLAEAALGPLLGPNTATAIRRAGSRQDGITLLLASPEFQRR